MAKRQITYSAYCAVLLRRYSRYATFTRRISETLGKSNTTIGRIYNTVYQRCRQQRQLIIDNFPNLTAFLPVTICVMP